MAVSCGNDSSPFCNVIFHKVTVTNEQFKKGSHFKIARNFTMKEKLSNEFLTICSWGISREILSYIK